MRNATPDCGRFDEVKWINQCLADDKGDAPEGAVLKYCTCMNNKMTDSETQSITQWEKTHVAERKACMPRRVGSNLLLHPLWP